MIGLHMQRPDYPPTGGPVLHVNMSYFIVVLSNDEYKKIQNTTNYPITLRYAHIKQGKGSWIWIIHAMNDSGSRNIILTFSGTIP